MAKLSDETLISYADGTLDPGEQRRVEIILTEDAEARARFEVLSSTGRLLIELIQKHGHAPTRLRRSVPPVLPKPATIPASPPLFAHRPRWSEVTDWFGTLRWRTPFPLSRGIMLALTLLAGTGAGWFMRSRMDGQPPASSEFVRTGSDRISAKGLLRGILETFRSGAGTTLAGRGNGAASVRVHMTFRNEAREYCREYEITMVSRERYNGIACRDHSGEWIVLIHALVAPAAASPGQTVPATSGNTPVDAVVMSVIDGDPMAASEETAAIARGWQK